MTSVADAAVLDRAAVILRERSRKPGSILLGAICRVLTGEAERIRAEFAPRFTCPRCGMTSHNENDFAECGQRS